MRYLNVQITREAGRAQKSKLWPSLPKRSCGYSKSELLTTGCLCPCGGV